MYQEQVLHSLFTAIESYRQSYEMLKQFRYNFYPGFLQSLFKKLDDEHHEKHLCDEESSFEYSLHVNYMCCCGIVEAIYPSLNAFSTALKEFYTLYDKMREEYINLIEYFNNLKYIYTNSQPHFDTSNEYVKYFYKNCFKKTFEQTLNSMNKCRSLFEVYTQKVVDYERLEI